MPKALRRVPSVRVQARDAATLEKVGRSVSAKPGAVDLY